MNEGINISPGDAFSVAKDDDGYPAVKVENRAWVEDPRWITVSAVGHDDERRIRDLAATLERLADATAKTQVKESA
jgi:hypothetical protein